MVIGLWVLCPFENTKCIPDAEMSHKTVTASKHIHRSVWRPGHRSIAGRLKVNRIWNPWLRTHFHPSPSVLYPQQSCCKSSYFTENSISSNKVVAQNQGGNYSVSILKKVVLRFFVFPNPDVHVVMRNFSHPSPSPQNFFTLIFCTVPFLSTLPPWQGLLISFPFTVFLLSHIWLSPSLSKYGHGG